MTANWVLGWSIGGLVVVIVVVLLLTMIVLASRVGDKAQAILDALDETRRNTEGLWSLQATNENAARIVAAASHARENLAAGS